jgi:hypothetical protein
MKQNMNLNFKLHSTFVLLVFMKVVSSKQATLNPTKFQGPMLTGYDVYVTFNGISSILNIITRISGKN